MVRSLGILSILVALMTIAAAAITTTHPLPLQGRKVALDPGHFETGDDTGAVNVLAEGMVIERDVNWEVVHATAINLEALGAEVLILRNTGEYVDRPIRYARANVFGADALLSVHHNGSDDRSVNYTATFYTDPNDKVIASLAYDHLRSALETLGGGVWSDTFGMTVHPQMPSTLTEAWFITNDETARRYLREARMRPATWETGEGWLPDTLVAQEATALTAAVREFLSAEATQSESSE